MAWVIPDKRFLKSHCHWFEGEWHRAPPTPPRCHQLNLSSKFASASHNLSAGLHPGRMVGWEVRADSQLRSQALRAPGCQLEARHIL